jgi:hypothetical protein
MELRAEFQARKELDFRRTFQVCQNREGVRQVTGRRGLLSAGDMAMVIWIFNHAASFLTYQGLL